MSVTLEALPASAVQAQVERIVESKAFRSSSVLRHLLTYLTEKCLAGAGETLKEYSIGLDALGKPESFDPRQESVVRMHTARLRQKLADYYRAEGVDDPIVIDLPKGGFKLTFEPRQAPQALQTEVSPPPPARWSRRQVGLVSALGIALIAVCLLLAVRWRPSDSTPGFSPELRQLWAPLMSPTRRIVICIATPLFVDVPGFGSLRDTSVNNWDDVMGSKGLSSVERALDAGMSAPSWDYTEVGTATGAFLLGQFLAPLRQNVLIKRSNLLSWPEIADDNVVFLGPPAGIHQVGDIPVDTQFSLEAAGIRNLHPRPGEAAFLADAPGRNGEEGGLSHALISRIPSMNGHGSILIFSGNQTASVTAGVQAFTDPAVARMLVAKLKSDTGSIPAYFQAALTIKSMDDVPVDIACTLHRNLAEPGKTTVRK